MTPHGCETIRGSLILWRKRKEIKNDLYYCRTLRGCTGSSLRGCLSCNCIYELEDTELSEGDEAHKMMLYIHPEECIDCGACEPECPVEAIFPEDEVPDKWNDYTRYNYEAFGFSPP